MAYTRVNLLERIVEIQNLTLEHKKTGASQKWIFDNFIQKQYRISRSTYNSYLAINAKAQLKKIKQQY